MFTINDDGSITIDQPQSVNGSESPDAESPGDEAKRELLQRLISDTEEYRKREEDAIQANGKFLIDSFKQELDHRRQRQNVIFPVINGNGGIVAS